MEAMDERCERGMEATQAYARRVEELLEAVERRQKDPEGAEAAGQRYAEAREALRDACVGRASAAPVQEGRKEKKQALQEQLAKKRQDMKSILDELRALDGQLVAWSDACPSPSSGCDVARPP